MAQQFSGFEWSTEADAFNDGFRQPEGIDNQGGRTGGMRPPQPSGTSRNATKETSPTRVTNVAPA